MLIIEGMLPFISPGKYRQMVTEVMRLRDDQIRTVGLIVMVVGLVLLFLIR